MPMPLLADHPYSICTTEGRFLLAQQLQTICDLDKPVIFSAAQWAELHLPQQGLNSSLGEGPFQVAPSLDTLSLP